MASAIKAQFSKSTMSKEHVYMMKTVKGESKLSGPSATYVDYYRALHLCSKTGVDDSRTKAGWSFDICIH